MTPQVLPGVGSVYLRRADESLSRHRRSPEDTCDWCTLTQGSESAYPCLAARIAIAVKEAYMRL